MHPVHSIQILTRTNIVDTWNHPRGIAPMIDDIRSCGMILDMLASKNASSCHDEEDNSSSNNTQNNESTRWTKDDLECYLIPFSRKGDFACLCTSEEHLQEGTGSMPQDHCGVIVSMFLLNPLSLYFSRLAHWGALKNHLLASGDRKLDSSSIDVE